LRIVGKEWMRARQVGSLAMALAGMLLAWCPFARALNPSLDVSQYAHTSWKVRDGFTKGTINPIAQTSDGYLWLGTDFGLLRFDGVRATPWQPPANQVLPSGLIESLLAARDGTLWIGTWKGLASWKDGKLTQYAELAGQAVSRLLEDREGTIWVGSYGIPSGRLCTIRNGRVHCDGEDGTLGHGVFGLYVDSKGDLWVTVLNGLWRWRPGSPHFYPMPGSVDSIRAFAEDNDGALIISTRKEIRRFVDGVTEPYRLPGTAQQLRVSTLLRDREGGLWIGTTDRGLLHVHQGRTDAFAQLDGLSGDYVSELFEDREGDIWVTTAGGVDRFRDFAVPTISVKQGLSNDVVLSVLASRDGSVWLSALGSLNRWNNGQIATYDRREGKVDGQSPNSLFEDDHGRIWVSTSSGFGYVENGRFVPISGVPGPVVSSIAEDNAGTLWIANQTLGLLHLVRGNMVEQVPWSRLGHKDQVTVLADDPLRGGLWLGFFNGGVAYFADGGVRASYSAANGLGDSKVNDLRFDQNGTLWASTEGGLSRLKNSHVATLTSKNGLPCDGVHWSVEDSDHAVWLYMPCGLVRIGRSDLDAWAAEVDRGDYPKRTIQTTVFDSSDGVRVRAIRGGYSPHVAKSADGKLWFTGLDGVSVLDPRHIPFNKIPPPVHVEQLIADRKTYDAASDANGHIRVPPLIRDLEIDYTALSLVVPEKVLFRYKLEGFDRDWQDVGNRRQAFYTNLPPRAYRFRVIACNNSGVWNETGAILDFSILPAYYQTTWFRLLCAAVFLLLLWTLYQLRLQQLRHQLAIGLEARVNERTRVARDLHDTLLQSFQGAVFQFQAARKLLLRNATNAMDVLDEAIQAAEEGIMEGRAAIHDLRPEPAAQRDLPELLNAAGHESADTKQAGRHLANFSVIVEGKQQTLPPMLQDEVYRISREVIRNAFAHAVASHIEVEIRYDQDQLRVRIRDDGKGIAPKILEGGGQPGHWGISGMRERAQRIGARLDFWSEVGAGTEVQLTVPAAMAYEKRRHNRRFRLFHRAGGDE
jgi:ligand-binding sensor domain-containing protein/signal transduction histidine kinase